MGVCVYMGVYVCLRCVCIYIHIFAVAVARIVCSLCFLLFVVEDVGLFSAEVPPFPLLRN